MNKIRLKIERKIIGIVRLYNQQAFQKVFNKWMCRAGIRINVRTGYVSPDVFFDETDYSLISIGKGTVISRGVTILVHDYSIEKAVDVYGEKEETMHCLFKSVELEDNCFIGANTILLPGAKVGRNSIIGAGSIVKGSIPSNVVAAGNPCRVICQLGEYYKKQLDKNKEYIRMIDI